MKDYDKYNSYHLTKLRDKKRIELERLHKEISQITKILRGR